MTMLSDKTQAEMYSGSDRAAVVAAVADGIALSSAWSKIGDWNRAWNRNENYEVGGVYIGAHVVAVLGDKALIEPYVIEPYVRVHGKDMVFPPERIDQFPSPELEAKIALLAG